MDSRTADYAPFQNDAGFAVVGARSQIEVAGDDRLKFLQNYCTADMNRLEPYQGTEAFITSVKGKVLGYVFIYCGEESLVIETEPGEAEKLIAHLDRYTLADDVELSDVSEGWTFIYVAGPKAEAILTKLTEDTLPQQQLNFIVTTIELRQAAISRGGAIGPDGYTLCCRSEDLEPISAALCEANVAACDAEVLEILRIESGMPRYGVDVTEENLPQEVNRNQQAISFTKGCYLGQETVARLDALGHVNKLLVSVKFQNGDAPKPGCELMVGDTPVGRVTSAIFSPRLDAPLALAYVRTQHSEAGTQLATAAVNAEVVDLPLA